MNFLQLMFCISLLLVIQAESMGQVNYDESKIIPYELPELLVDENGKEIADAESWLKLRRPYVLNKLEHDVYGRFPDEYIKVDFELRSAHKLADINGMLKNIDMILTNGVKTVTVDLSIFLPDSDEPSPVFLALNFFGNQSVHPSTELKISQSWSIGGPKFGIIDNHATAASRGVRAYRWPVKTIIERGYGLAVMHCGELDPDFDDDFENGIHALLTPSQKQITQGISTISAWSYGLSKAMDYFETDADIDQDRVAVFGHSRLGKTSLWVGAKDERFAMVISNESGCGGAALSRRKIGETVKIINTSFPHWFSKHYKKVSDHEQDQDFDQHMLIALMAPRPIYVASAQEDRWADPIGEFLSLYHAGKVYKLFGDDTFEEKNMPDVNQALMKGKMAYHMRAGVHNVTQFDWDQYLKFADIHLK